MKYEDIKHFNERIHQRKGPVNAAEIQLLLHEEIAELRHYIEANLPKPAPTLWGKVAHDTYVKDYPRYRTAEARSGFVILHEIDPENNNAA